MEEEQKISKTQLIKLSWLVLDLMGRGTVISKGKIAEESCNNHVMTFLKEQAYEKSSYFNFDEKDIDFLNDYISLQLSNLRLDRDENVNMSHIYDKDTQGLNTLLVMLIHIFYTFFIEEEKKIKWQ